MPLNTRVEIDVTPRHWRGATPEAIGKCIASVIAHHDISKVIATREQLIVLVTMADGVRTLEDVKALRDAVTDTVNKEHIFPLRGHAA